MKKRIKKTMWIIFILIAFLTVFTIIFMNTAPFGRLPSGERLEKVKSSPNYRNGKFQNLSETPQISSDKSYIKMLWEFQFKKDKRVKPKDAIPHVKTDLHNLDRSEDVMIWFGHSSLFIQIDGKRFLVDPVLDKPAAPVFFYNKPFKGADNYTIEDIPEIDYLVITHDHYDHLDYKIAKSLQNKLQKVICPLGVGEHFEYWGFEKDKIIEMDWNDKTALEEGFGVICLPARHFSGRSIKPMRSLWASYLVQTPTFKFYLGGDSGYDAFYGEIGEKFGPIDLAALDNGQYDDNWKYIHMHPEQTAQAAQDLKAKRFLSIHSSKYVLGAHAWDDPLIRVSKALEGTEVQMITPKIGEKTELKNPDQKFEKWWIGIN